MVPIFVINLDRSRDRWDAVSESGANAGLAIERIPAVDTSLIPPGSPYPGLDEQRFRRYHGRKVLPGEYGCYRSHLAALGRVTSGGHGLAIIAEDDIQFEHDFEERVCQIMAADPGIELLKLVNHRTKGFITCGQSAAGDEFGRCMHGPLGSSACYAITQTGSYKLHEALKTMWLPYDAAFERGWSTGVATYTVRNPLVTFQPLQAETTIAARSGYDRVKLPKHRRLPVLGFRTQEYLRRAAYAIRCPRQ